MISSLSEVVGNGFHAKIVWKRCVQRCNVHGKKVPVSWLFESKVSKKTESMRGVLNECRESADKGSKDFVQVGGDIHSGAGVRRHDGSSWSRNSSFMDFGEHIKVSYLRARVDEVLS